MYNKYDSSTIEQVKEEFNLGLNKCQLSKKFNIPRNTIRYWLSDKYNKSHTKNNSRYHIKNIYEYLKNKRLFYSYILGIYLGDGCISNSNNSYKLRITLDKRYYNIVEECAYKLKMLFENNSVSIFEHKDIQMYTVSVYSCDLVNMFPQHGDGLKYKRLIILEDFQNDIIDDVQLIKGLFHSDGCLYKSVNIKKNKEYISYNYNFSNMSKDIVDIYCESMKRLNINYKISISKFGCYRVNTNKKLDFKKMYQLIGTKNIDMITEIEKYCDKPLLEKETLEKSKIVRNSRLQNYCSCGKKITYNAKNCPICDKIRQRKVSNRPNKEELTLLVSSSSLEAVGRSFGVTGNTIKKWLK